MTIHNEYSDLTNTDSIVALWPSYPTYGVSGTTPPAAGVAGYGHGPSRGIDRGANHARNDLFFSEKINENSGKYSAKGLLPKGVELLLRQLMLQEHG